MTLKFLGQRHGSGKWKRAEVTEVQTQTLVYLS